MDATTALILSDAIDGFMEQAVPAGISLIELKVLVARKLAEQRVAPEVLAAWAARDEGRAK